MSLKECVDKARKAKLIADDDIRDLYRRIKPFQNQLEISYGPEGARIRAELRAVTSKITELRRKKYNRALQIEHTRTNVRDQAAHPNGMLRGAMSLMTKDQEAHLGVSPWSNVDNRAHAILAWLHSQWSEALSALRTRTLGFTQNRERLLNVVRELFGKNTGDDLAAEFARGWTGTAEKIRLRFNRAGGAIPKRADWGMLQSHSQKRVGKVEADEWAAFTVPLLDKKRMFNWESGVPYTDRDIDEMMLRIHESIRTNGLSDMEPGELGRGIVAKRHQEHRYLVFKDADSWIEYQEKFGEPDIFSTMTGHLRRLAHETAYMEKFGPDADAGYQYVRALALKEEGGMNKGMWLLDAVNEVVSGRVDATESVSLADFSGGVRHLLVASQLGTAFISAMSDVAFQGITRLYNGLPVMGFIRKTLSQMSPGNEADRKFAVYLGQVAEAWTTRALAGQRMGDLGEVTGTLGKMSEAVLRASLLTPWTDGARKAFGMAFLKNLADLSGKGFKELPEKVRKGFKNYGITPRDWDLMRSSEMVEHEGVRYMRPENSARVSGVSDEEKVELMTKFLEMLASETDFAVPMPDARIRAVTTGGGRARGTIGGELGRAFGLYKSFPLTVISTHLYRGGLNRLLRGDFKNVNGTYLATLIIGLTVIGAFAVQLRQIAKGKDPLDMEDPKFWMKAFIQGGGAGIVGDFLYSDVSRFGKGRLSTFAGPVLGLGEDVLELTLDNIQAALGGKDPKLARDLLLFGKRYMPGGNIWYTRLALERLVFDQLREEVDPKAHRAWGRIERKMKKESGQKFWWRHGKTSPHRPPNIESVIGGS